MVDERSSKLFEWSNAMSVGDYAMDNQHQKLLLICRRCEELRGNLTPDGVQLFHEQLHEMQVYSRIHFSAEEGLLARIGYPKLDEQKQEHLKYQDEMAEILYQAAFGNLDAPSVVQFLSKWWVNHILILDMEYATYLKTCEYTIRRNSLRSEAISASDQCRRTSDVAAVIWLSD
jgi:hemerythrin